MYEHQSERLLPRPAFLRRVAWHAASGAGLVLASLMIGILGYRLTEGMSWIDAYLNAAMLMGGMGPVGEIKTPAGKIFAGTYALYCGLVLLMAAGVVIAPVLHRLMHKFHLPEK